MLRYIITAGILCAATQAFSAAPHDVLTGTFSNEEQVYFDKEAGRAGPAWRSLRVIADGDTMIFEDIDAYGNLIGKPRKAKTRQEGETTVLDFGECEELFRQQNHMMISTGVRGGYCDGPNVTTTINRFALTEISEGGTKTELRRSRPVTCWSAISKTTKKADGSDDWYFARNVQIHDQGGRALIGKDVADVKPLVIRMRNVVWPAGNSNRPSLVMYIHSPDEPDKALSYVWADPGAARIGINLRWMQASCTVDGAE